MFVILLNNMAEENIHDIHEDTNEKHLYAIIEKPQKGKTFICLENIKQTPDTVHFIITMNTIKSNLQFMERAYSKFGNNLCVLNSNPGDFAYNHSKDIIGIYDYITEHNITNVIMCAHYTRFNKSLMNLVKLLQNHSTFNKNIVIHIDEAHAYIPSHRKNIIILNNYPIVSRIFLYSATPFECWEYQDNQGADYIFKNIFVVDVCEQFSITQTDQYFGVKDCNYIVIEDTPLLISDTVPNDIIEQHGNETQKRYLYVEKWYSKKYCFSIGNELNYLSFVKHTLEKLYKEKRIDNNSFSYNFVPGYCRKLTHYMIVKLILSRFSKSIIIVINGNGSFAYMFNDNMFAVAQHELPLHNEPSEQIYKFVNRFPDRPVFITGFHCIGMSVTLINEKLGNFDNVFMGHSQYLSHPEILYQLCRFVFNYISWKQKTFKKTHLYLMNNSVLQTCLDYEKQIDTINNTMKGSIRTKSEIVGDVKIKGPKKTPEQKYKPLEKYQIVHPIKTFTKDEDMCEQDVLDKVKRYYRTCTNKELSSKWELSKKIDGFYECSLHGGKKKQTNVSQFKAYLKKINWHTLFALSPKKTMYTRIFVVYDDPSNKNEYTWIIRRMEIQDNEDTQRIWVEINK